AGPAACQFGPSSPRSKLSSNPAPSGAPALAGPADAEAAAAAAPGSGIGGRLTEACPAGPASVVAAGPLGTQDALKTTAEMSQRTRTAPIVPHGASSQAPLAPRRDHG